MKRMICYRRVSTDEQADRGYSLPSQHDSIQSYANQNGFQIVADFADDCSGAIPLADRPEGGKAVAMLKRKGVDGLIAHHVDRLSRDLVDALATVRDLTRSGLEIHTLDVGRIDAETGIVLVIKAWQGSDERKKIAERSKRGRDTKARNGKVVGVGEPLYGFRYAMADRKRVGYETLSQRLESSATFLHGMSKVMRNDNRCRSTALRAV